MCCWRADQKIFIHDGKAGENVLVSNNLQVRNRASMFTQINGNVSCIYDKRLQNLYIV